MVISNHTLCPPHTIIAPRLPAVSLLYGFNYGTASLNIYDGFKAPKTCCRAVDTITIALVDIVLHQNVTSSDNLCPRCLVFSN